MRSLKTETRNSARPGSQAPHAPPALTFGLPGKQRVKQVAAGCDLIRLLRTLPGNRNNYVNGTPCRPAFAAAQDGSPAAIMSGAAADPGHYG
jgi:hypothetical protein